MSRTVSGFKAALIEVMNEQEHAPFIAALAHPAMLQDVPRIGLSYEEVAMKEVAELYWSQERPILYRLFGERLFGAPDWQRILEWIQENLPKILEILMTLLPFLI